STTGAGSATSWPAWRVRSTTSSYDATTVRAGARFSSRAVLSTRSRHMLVPHGREVHGKRCNERPRMHYGGSSARKLCRAIGLAPMSHHDRPLGLKRDAATQAVT